MSRQRIVPDDFAVPEVYEASVFRLELLGPRHNEADHAAWMSSIAHIRATPGFDRRGWPPEAGMTLEENLADLVSHADRSARRVDFAYTVLDRSSPDRVIGCVYFDPHVPDPHVSDPYVPDPSVADRRASDLLVSDSRVAEPRVADPDAFELHGSGSGGSGLGGAGLGGSGLSGSGLGGSGAVRAASWVTAEAAELDRALTEVVTNWLVDAWPFPVVHYRLGRRRIVLSATDRLGATD